MKELCLLAQEKMFCRIIPASFALRTTYKKELNFILFIQEAKVLRKVYRVFCEQMRTNVLSVSVTKTYIRI